MIALALSLAAFWLCAGAGAPGAWLMRRRTSLSIKNLSAGAPWTLLLDEFGGVMNIAASRVQPRTVPGESARSPASQFRY